MFINHRQEKLLNAIAFFTRKTKHCHTLKLCKLLYFLDFEHYRQTGKSVTGLDYHALPHGPVPGKWLNEIGQENGKEISELKVMEQSDEVTGALCKREFKVKELDDTYFTLRELKIMERLVLFFGEAKAETMIALSHDPKLPWKKVYGKGEGLGNVIPYELALESNPIVNDEPTIEKEEILMLDEVFAGTGLR